MKTCAITVFSVVLLFGILSASQASFKIVLHEQVTIFVEDSMYNILGQKTFVNDYTSPSQPQLPEPLSLSYNLSIDSWPGKSLFGDVPLQSNVGKTIWLNAACEYPDYSAFIITLTDGRNDRLSGTFTLDSAGNPVRTDLTRFYESTLWPKGGTTDFYGYRIGRIGLRIDAATVTQIPGTPGGGGVPEPCSVSIVLCGLECLGFLRRRRIAA